jgi:hypothetical protein
MRRALVAAAAVLLVACDSFPTNCVARGATTTFTGSVTYSGQTDAPAEAPLTGSLAMSLTVYDATPECTYDAMEFTLALGSCQLWAVLTSPSGEDAGTGLTATVEPNQTCTLDLATGTVSMAVTEGLLAEATSTTLTLGGSITTASDGGAGSGYLEWSFVGQ